MCILFEIKLTGIETSNTCKFVHLVRLRKIVCNFIWMCIVEPIDAVKVLVNKIICSTFPPQIASLNFFEAAIILPVN